MFERSIPSEVDKDAQSAEGRSPDQIAALRLAAVLIVANVLVTLAVIAVLRLPGVPILRIGIALVVAYYLYKLRPRAETLALGLALVGSVLYPLLLLMELPLITALIEALPVWGLTGALLLLLTGDPSRTRRIAAVALFAVLTVGLYGLAVLVQLASR